MITFDIWKHIGAELAYVWLKDDMPVDEYNSVDTSGLFYCMV